MYIKKYLLVIIFLFIFYNCASYTKMQPESKSDSIVIGINIYGPLIKTLYFINIDQQDSYLSDKKIIRSNLNINNKFYLFNAKPGRYIIVAGSNISYSGSNFSKETATVYYYPMKFIKLTDITVKEGNIYYLGDHYIWYDASLIARGASNLDEAQSFYCKRLQPGKENQVLPRIGEVLTGALSGYSEYARAAYIVEGEKYVPLTEIEFWEKTLQALKGNFIEKMFYEEDLATNEEWMNIINNKLRLLKNKETK